MYFKFFFSDQPTNLAITESMKLLDSHQIYRYEISLYGKMQLILCQIIELTGMLI